VILDVKALLALSAIAALGAGVTACGSAGKGAASTSSRSPNTTPTNTVAVTASNTTPGITDTTATGSTQIAGLYKDSNDGDNDANSDDDAYFLYYGHAPSKADQRAVIALVKGYFVAAAAADGAKACPLIYGIVAETIVEEYGELPEFSGSTCAVVMSKLFKHRHQQMAADLAGLEVTRVRLGGTRGYAFLYRGDVPAPFVLLHRESGSWKIESLFEINLG
jgi:hypothetical protein